MTNSAPSAEIPDRFSRDVLEFAGVIELLRGFLTGPIAAARVDAIEPRTDLDAIRRDLELVKEAREFVAESPRPGFSGINDPRPPLDKLGIEGVTLDPQEILGLVEVARAACDLRGLFAKSPFKKLDALAGR